MFQVGEGRRESTANLGCGVNHFLITGPFPPVWRLACGPACPSDISSQRWVGSQHIWTGSEPDFTVDRRTHESESTGMLNAVPK